TRVEQLPEAHRAHASQDARTALRTAGVVATSAREQHVRGQLDLEARGARIARHRAVRAPAVARLETTLRAVKGVMSPSHALGVLLGVLFHLIAEVQFELVVTSGAGTIDDNHEDRASCLSKCVPADVIERQSGPNSRHAQRLEPALNVIF